MHHIRRTRDGGFYMVEVMVAIMIISLVLAVVATSFGVITGRADAAGCDRDARVLEMAVEVHRIQSGDDELPASGLGVDRFELGLVDAELLQSRSELYDLDSAGRVLPAPDSPCTSRTSP